MRGDSVGRASLAGPGSPAQETGEVLQNQTIFWDTYHSLQFNVNRRFARGLSFGANYTYGISLKG